MLSPSTGPAWSNTCAAVPESAWLRRSVEKRRQQLKLIDALTIAQAGRIAGYGTRQATHKAYNSILRRMPGILRKRSGLGAFAHAADKG